MTVGTEHPLIYVVDDDEAFRDSLRWLLESAGFRVAAFATAEHFLASYSPRTGACLVLDVRMPGWSGLELQEEMIRRGHAIPIIFVTGHGDVPMAVNAVKKGAVDFIEKPFNDMELLALIENAMTLSGQALQNKTRQLSAAMRLARLTQREHEVMELVVAGKLNKVIADELGISIKTVEAHRAKVMEKTGAGSVAELVKIVLDSKTPR
ncbi:MAG: response regulator transcription factor [Burkholderiales bacterium]